MDAVMKEATRSRASEAQLIADWKAGDPTAFRTLFTRWAPQMRRPLGWLIPRADAADRATVRVFSTLYEMGRSFSPDVPVATWLLRQALAEGVAWRRENPGICKGLRATGVPPARGTHRGGLSRTAERLATLPVEYMIPVVLRYLCGMPCRAVAEVLGKSPEFVVQRLHVGLCEMTGLGQGRSTAECDPPAVLARHEGLLSDVDRAKVNDHLDHCQTCAHRDRWLRAAIEGLTAYGQTVRLVPAATLWAQFTVRHEQIRAETPRPEALVVRLGVAAAVLGILTIALCVSMVGRGERVEKPRQVAEATTAVTEPAPAPVPSGTLSEREVDWSPPPLPVPRDGVGKPPVAEVASPARVLPGETGRPADDGPPEPGADAAAPVNDRPPVVAAPRARAPMPARRAGGSRPPQRPVRAVPAPAPAPPTAQPGGITARVLDQATRLAPRE